MKKFAFIVFPVFLLAIFFISKTALAEIATTKDWIGLFATGTPDGKANTVTTATNTTFIDGHGWVYTSSCTQTAGAVPKLSDSTGCVIVPNPMPTSGTYEYRMYAYDQGSADALIAKSNPMTVAVATPGPGGGIPCPIQATNPRVINGLISASDVGSNFGNSNATCVTGSPASFAPYKIPSYDDIKSIYFTQSKALKATNTGANLAAVADGNIYNYTNTAGVSTGAYNYTDTAVVFINGSLSINGNITGTSAKGLVLVTGGDIIIDKSVTNINAVLISGGKIYTAGAGCTKSSETASQLVINGSLISLNSANTIAFCRTLGVGNTSAAELINNQPKYLVILKDLMSDTWQKWSEI